MSERTALYRHWDASGNLLYVGVSASIGSRLSAHRRESHWFQDIVNVTIEYHDTRRQALDAEEAAIKGEKPKHNVIHTPLHAERSRKQQPPKNVKSRNKPYYIETVESWEPPVRAKNPREAMVEFVRALAKRQARLDSGMKG